MNATSKRISQSIRMMQKCRPHTAAIREWKAATIKSLEVEQIQITSLDGEQAGLVALTEYAIRHDRKALYANMLVSMYQNPDNLSEAVSAASRTRLNEWFDVPSCEIAEFEEVRRMFHTANKISLWAVKQILYDEFAVESEFYDDLYMPL